MNSPPPRVVVLGAGMAGLESAFLLERRLAGRADIQVVDEYGFFLFRPNLVYVPFGADPSATTLNFMQFAAGQPFQAGPGWRFMDHGVHAMAGML